MKRPQTSPRPGRPDRTDGPDRPAHPGHPVHPVHPAHPSIRARPVAATGRALLAGAIMAVLAAPMSVLAVEQTVDFGAPVVLSQQGQRLKVVVPVRSAPDDRATAASFMVRETEVPQGYAALPAGTFTVMRPAKADYVVFQSEDTVRSPEVTLTVSVAGDPRSPYRMDLKVPPGSATGDRLASTGRADGAVARARAAAGGTGDRIATRRLRGPVGDASLPPK